MSCEKLFDELPDLVSLLVYSQLLYLCHILQEDRRGNVVVGVGSEALLQHLQIESQRHQPSYSLTCARIVRSRGLHFATRGKYSLKNRKTTLNQTHLTRKRLAAHIKRQTINKY